MHHRVQFYILYIPTPCTHTQADLEAQSEATLLAQQAKVPPGCPSHGRPQRCLLPPSQFPNLAVLDRYFQGWADKNT